MSRNLAADAPTDLANTTDVDHCNAVLTELPGSTTAPLQHVLNAAARGDESSATRSRHCSTGDQLRRELRSNSLAFQMANATCSL